MRYKNSLLVALLLLTTQTVAADLQYRGSTYSSELFQVAFMDSLLVGTTTSGIEVLALRDTLPPEPIAQLRLYDQRGQTWWDYGITDIKISGQTAYVVDCNGNLYSIDLSNPLDPTVIETVELPSPVTAMDVSGFVACVAYGSYLDSTGILLLDLSTPTDIAVIGGIRFPDFLNPSQDVAIRDTVMFATWQGALLAYDIADPSAPVLLDSTSVYHKLFIEIELDRTGSLIYLLDRGFSAPACISGMTVLDAANPADLQVLYRTETWGASYELAINDNFCFLDAGSWGLLVYDRVDAEHPASLALLPIDYFAGDVVANESLAVLTDLGTPYSLNLDIEKYECQYVGDPWTVPFPPLKLTMIDVTSPVPVLKASYTLPSPIHNIAIAGNGTVFALNKEGWYDDVMSIETTNPYNPKWIGSCLTSFGNSAGVVVDTILYVASTGAGTLFTPGIRTINVADPSNPFVIAEETLAVGGINFQVRDTLLYVMRAGAGMSILDISSPGHPTTVFTYDSPGSAQDVCFSDSLAYIADGNYGIIVLSMPRLSNVQWVGECGTSGANYTRIMIRDSLLVAFTPHSIELFDILSDPFNPVSIASSPIGPDIGDFSFDGDIMYGAAGETGILAYDISNLADPELIAQYDTPVNALAVEVVDSMVYVADQENLVVLQMLGATVVDGDTPTRALSFQLHQNYPNPFNPTTTIAYSLTQSADVELKVYNLLGQEVAVLAEGSQSAGLHQVRWDASEQASGIYLYRLRAGDAVTTKKMLLLK
jgi:hypothetical protein